MAETFQNEHVGSAVCRMLNECSDIKDIAISCCEGDDSQIIDYDSFEDFRCSSPLSFIEEAIICQPTGLTTLLNELSDQFMFFLYYDSQSGKIKIKDYKPPFCDQEFITIEECQIAQGSFSTKDTDDRYNQITYLHSPIDCSKGISESNFGAATATVSADSLAAPCERREYKTRKTKTIKSRWITQGNTYIARANGERWLRIRKCTGKQVSFDVDFDLAACLTLGGYVKINHKKLQEADGSPMDTAFMLKGISNNGACSKLTFERTDFDNSISPCLTCEGECATLATTIDPCQDQECIGIW